MLKINATNRAMHRPAHSHGWTFRNSLLIGVAVGLIVWGVWIMPGSAQRLMPTVTIDDYTPYLLSTIGQSLAAVLALVFSISLVVAQISSKYSHRVLAHFFDKSVIGYIVLFVITIVLQFCLLGNTNVAGLKASIVFSILCMGLLVPYFIHYRERLSPEYMLMDLGKSASKELRLCPSDVPKSVSPIEDIMMSAFGYKDYETFGKGASILVGLVYEAEKLRNQEERNVTTGDALAIIKRLNSITRVTMADPRAPLQVLEAFRVQGRIAISNNREDIAEIFQGQSALLGIEAIEKGFEEVADEAIMNVGLMGLQKAEQVESKEWNMTAENGLGFLDAMSSGAIEKRMSNVLHGLIPFLARIGRAAISLKRVEAAKYAMSSISSIGINAAKIEFLEELQLVGSWLLALGAMAIITKNEESRITAVRETQQVLRVMSVEMHQLILSKAIEIHGKNPNMKVALGKFAHSCGIKVGDVNAD